MELTTPLLMGQLIVVLFMMSKIQNLNGTHNVQLVCCLLFPVVYDVKDTKFEWNSQQGRNCCDSRCVVYDVKDTKFEWNSQPNHFV